MTFLKRGMFLKLWICLILLGLYVISACTHEHIGTSEALLKFSPDPQDKQRETCLFLNNVLSRDGRPLDYDTLMEIHQIIHRSEGPIPNLGDILVRLIDKTNPNPRVDNMILIIAAVSIGNSPYPIDNAGRLFERILDQPHRLNSWVLAYLGDAIGKYLVDLPEGDHLADMLEERSDYVATLSREFFGYHFLPPPKGDYIRDYLAGINDQKIRVFERNCYYMLIGNGLKEDHVETALRQVRDHGIITGTGGTTDRPMKYLISHWNRFFKEIKPVRVSRPAGL